jgi:hypothetical protein
MLHAIKTVVNIYSQEEPPPPAVFQVRFTVMAEEQQTKFGFTQFAENWNGRLAMLGFVIGLATEFLTGKGILEQLGLM